MIKNPHEIYAFNGDADGLCALQQLTFTKPLDDCLLVTGVKRDIKLLRKLSDYREIPVTVLDVSLDSNREGLMRLLSQGCPITYFDHHFADPVPEHPLLQSHIDTNPETCTSLIVDRFLSGKYRKWAVVGAFGDNQQAAAKAAARNLVLDETELAALKEIGELINYNAYGETEEDLHFKPLDLFAKLKNFSDPLDFFQSQTVAALREGYSSDLQKARAVKAALNSEKVGLYIFDEAPWARRVMGSFVNDLVTQDSNKAYALLVASPAGSYVVSLRVPKTHSTGADVFCRRFPTGGGRAKAAGINALPASDLESFIQNLSATYNV